VGSRAGLDTQIKEKIACLCRGSNLDGLVVQPVARAVAVAVTVTVVILGTLHPSQCRAEGRLSDLASLRRLDLTPLGYRHAQNFFEMHALCCQPVVRLPHNLLGG
jgi:hypothetical protein